METNKKFGLIGKDISYSFSKKYFTEKFSKELFDDCTYENFDIPNIEEFPNVLKENPDLKGLNVTIPYKEAIIPEFSEYTDLKTLEREYDYIYKQLKIDDTVDTYKKYLMMGFWGLEFVLKNFFKFEEIDGFLI